jgi:hypothetical protein
MAMYLRFPSVIYASDSAAHYGPETTIDPECVMAVEPKLYSYHTFRPAQQLAVITMRGGNKVEVLMTAERVSASIDDALRRLMLERAREQEAPEQLKITARALELACFRLEQAMQLLDPEGETPSSDALKAEVLDAATRADAIGRLDGLTNR